jgi:Mg-chelatase subunit ChlD
VRISQETQDSILLDAWRGVFQKTNRILSEQKVTVSIVADPDSKGMAQVPAWSDGLDIFLSGPKVKEMLAANDKLAAVLRLKGLNYHELCHVLYTPRMNDELPRRLVKKVQETGDNTWWYAFNALEDQRIETWFTSMYGASRRYFEATILEWIIKNGSAESAVLIYGRKYLTPRIRVQAGRVFRKRYDKALYDEFQTVIDEYLTLVLPADSIKAMSLLHTFVDLLKKMQSMHGAPLPVLVIADNGGAQCPAHGQEGVARNGRVLVKPARRARDRAAEQIEDAIDADLAEEARRAGEDGEGQGAGGGQEADGEGAGKGKAQQSQPNGGGESGDQGSGQQGPGSDQIASGGGAGESGAVENHVKTPGDTDADEKAMKDEMDDLMQHAYDDLDEVRDDEDVQEDVDNVLDAVKAAVNNGRMNAAGAAVGGATFPPSSAANMAVRRVHDILARIRQEAEPETLWRQVHGRLDGRRWVQRKPHETDVFKTWDHGNEEETGVESVILVDVSGSMGHILQEASMAMWALKRAFDKLDIRTTVLIFDTDHTVMYQPGEKAVPSGIPALRPGGGTNPSSALKQAEYILSKSSAPNKVLITVTDGQWSGGDDYYKRQMRRLHSIGVVSMLLGLGGARGRYGSHYHHEAHDLASISELPKAALKLVANIMRNAINV